MVTLSQYNPGPDTPSVMIILLSMTSVINPSQPSIHTDAMFQPPFSLTKLLLVLVIDAGLQALHAKRDSLSAQFADHRCLAVVKPWTGGESADPARTTEATPHPDRTMENIFRNIMIHKSIARLSLALLQKQKRMQEKKLDSAKLLKSKTLNGRNWRDLH